MTERIQGKDSLRLIRQLCNDRTLIRISSADKNYEQLTMIADIQDKGGHFFLIDPPVGFAQFVKKLDISMIHFGFTARDGFRYKFKASSINISDKDIWIKLPEFIEKVERRGRLRFEIPFGIVFCFEEDHREYKLKVINISRGGVLVEIPDPETGLSGTPILNYGKRISDSKLVFPSEDKGRRIRIKKAFIIRSSENSEVERRGIAIQFTEIQDDERAALKKMISDIQRNIFRNR